MSATGQASQDIAFGRPGPETIVRFALNAGGGKVAVAGVRFAARVGGNKFADSIMDYAAGKYAKQATDFLDPERCPK